MGREIRRVPANWIHPKNQKGEGHQPMFDEDFETAAQKWKDGLAAWERGERESYFPKDEYPPDFQYWEWSSGPPDDREYYRPKWTDEERTHYQLYETVSEGTPGSPPCESPEALAKWLSENGTYWEPRDKRTYEDWLIFIRVGWAPSGVLRGGTFQDGVSAIIEQKR